MTSKTRHKHFTALKFTARYVVGHLLFYVPIYPLAMFVMLLETSSVPRNFVRGGGSTNSVEDRGQRERGSGGGSPLVRGSGGSCNLVQEISFHIGKFP